MSRSALDGAQAVAQWCRKLVLAVTAAGRL
jgi:hypothetical protein